MSEGTLPLPITTSTSGPAKKKRVLLVDTSRVKRDLRSETMRRLGIEVDCAADVSEARCWWRADLYDLSHLLSLAAGNPWLTLVPVVESDADAATMQQGTLADVVTRYGAWADRDVLVAGSPAMIRSTVSRMLVAGTPLDRITYDPFTLD